MQLDDFRNEHHLYDDHRGVVYCYIAKNACSTFKYHFLKNIPEIGDVITDARINADLHKIAKKYSSTRNPIGNFQNKYIFAIVRHPLERIASAFLDKFVRHAEVPRYARKLMEHVDAGSDPTAWTFSNFVSALGSAPIEALNEHWMPQYVHFYEDIEYDLVPMEGMADNARLAQIYGDLSGNVREHSLTYGDVDGPAHDRTVRELRRIREEHGVVPSWRSLVQPALRERLLAVYGPDFALYEQAQKSTPKRKRRQETQDCRNNDSQLQTQAFSTGDCATASRALISVILPVYNVERHIQECMDSVVAQDDDHFELIAVDDGSRDSSIEIVKSYYPCFGERLRIIQQPNRGLGGARNTGVREARGEFVTFIDSDDVIACNYLSVLREIQTTENYDVVSGGYQKMSEAGVLLDKTPGPYIPEVASPLSPSERVLGAYTLSVAWGRLYRACLLRERDLVFPEQLPHEDWFFTYKVMRSALRVGEIETVLYWWRQRDHSLSKSITQAHLQAARALWRDTTEYLHSARASYREWQLAAKRNLGILRNFERKVRRYDQSIEHPFYEMINEHQADLRRDISLAVESVFCDPHSLEKARKLLDLSVGRCKTDDNARRERQNADHNASLSERGQAVQCNDVGGQPHSRPVQADGPRTGVDHDLGEQRLGATDERTVSGKMEPGLISVILPIYNVEQYIRECMDSLVAQDEENFELIVVDDGSADSSIDLVASYQPFFGQRLRIVQQENRGLGGARNAGVRVALGEFVTFVDSDDFVTEDYISALRSGQQRSLADVVTGAFTKVTEDGRKVEATGQANIPVLSPPLCAYERVLGGYDSSVAWARLYRRSLLISHHLWFPENVPHEDWFFTYKTLRVADKTHKLNESVYYWRQREGSLSKSVTEAHLSSLFGLRSDVRKFFEHYGAGERDYALSARRSLTFLTYFRRKIERIDRTCLKCYQRNIRRDAAELRDDMQRVRRSGLDERNLVNATEKVLNEAFETEPDVQHETDSDRSCVYDFLFFPLRAYHLVDGLPVVDGLREEGYSIGIVDTGGWRQGGDEVHKAAREHNVTLLKLDHLYRSYATVKCVVMWNDWDPLMRMIAKACHEAGVETIGWVEGIQDYLCADMPERSSRCPYRRSGHVILPGAFDKRYFRKTGQNLEVGEVVRVTSLWRERRSVRKEACKPTALINSNFSYGVLEEYRDAWVSLAVGACVEAGFDPVISRHPFDKGELYPEFHTQIGFFEAVRNCDVTIQRFASGILEALAIGVPVVYFNPHGERVDKFKEPNGAYLTTETRRELEVILREGRYFWDERAAESFLKLHAGLREDSVDPGARIAQILRGIVAAAKPPKSSFAEKMAGVEELKDPKLVRKRAKEIGPFYGDVTSNEGIVAVNREGRSNDLVETDTSGPSGSVTEIDGKPARWTKAYSESVVLSNLIGAEDLRPNQAKLVLRTYATMLLLNGGPVTGKADSDDGLSELIQLAKKKLRPEHPAVEQLDRVASRVG